MNQKTTEPGEAAPDGAVCLQGSDRLGTPGMHGIGGAAEYMPV